MLKLSRPESTATSAAAAPPARDRRGLWLTIGAIFGAAVASLLPSEPAHAQVVEGGDKFAMAAVPTITSTADAVIVLDYLTGRLYGAQYSPNTGKFSAYYLRNLADDFDLGGQGEPQFTLLPAFLNPRTRGGGPVATGGIYVGELTSGKVCLYGISLQPSRTTTPNNMPTIPIQLIDQFEFRQSAGL